VSVLTRDDVAALSREERAALARWLAEVDELAPPPRRARLSRLTVLWVASIGAVVLVPWTLYLAATLPERHREYSWRLAWIGFDVALTVALGATAWLGWRSRQLVLVALVVSATLLACDAWFDVVLSWGGRGQWLSVATALLVELPLAALLGWASYRLLRATAKVMRHRQGIDGPLPRLFELPLVVGGPIVRDPTLPANRTM
jgi:hypothetical protein